MNHARIFVTMICISAAAPRAFAQSASAQAESLFNQGRELMAAGKYADACAAFEASQKLDPAVTTALNLGGCREKNGQLASAWGVFVDVERQLRGASDASSKQLQQLAAKRATVLELRLSKLTIAVPVGRDVPGLEVRRNDEVVDRGAWNRALPIDGGTYKIVARAPGYDEWSTTIAIKIEGDAQTIEVPALAVAKAAQVGAKGAARRKLAVPLAVGGGALALLGVGLGLELAAESTYSAAKAEMIDNTRRQSLYDSANTKRHVAQVFAIGGVAAAGVAVWLYLRGGRGEAAPPGVKIGRARVMPTLGGLAMTGAF